MGIIETLLEEIKSSDLDQQIRELCKQISEEEIKDSPLPEYAPDGPNVFLTIEVPGKNKKEFGFLCLEREDVEKYITVLWTITTKEPTLDKLRKRHVWEIKEVKANKILKEYAKIIKYMKGE